MIRSRCLEVSRQAPIKTAMPYNLDALYTWRFIMKKMLLVLLALLSFSLSAFAAVNINTATQAELESLDGIGPAKAQAIIDYRKANGNFKSVDDLNNVKGIGDKTMAKLKSNLSVSGTTTVPATTKTEKAAPATKATPATPATPAAAPAPAKVDDKAADKPQKADDKAAKDAEKKQKQMQKLRKKLKKTPQRLKKQRQPNQLLIKSDKSI